MVTAFIDLSGRTFGDPRYDIALAIGAFLKDADLLNVFYEGYGGERISMEEYAYFEGGLYEFF